MSIFESLENLNVSEECFDEIMEKVNNILHTGHPEKEDNKYIVTSKHDNGELKTQVHAPSADAARDAVNNVEGGPKRAHQVLVQDNPERTAEEVKKSPKVVGVAIKHGKTAQTPMLKKHGIDTKKIPESLMEEIMGIVEELLGEGREPFETQQAYKERLQKYFGPKLNDAKSAQKAIAKHHDKVAKGLKKEEKVLRDERNAAWDKDAEAHKKWKDSLEVADAVKDKHGENSELYKEVNDKEGKAFDKWMRTTKKVQNAKDKLEAVKNKRYGEEDKRNDAIFKVTDLVARKMKTGTYDQKQENK